MKTETTLRLSVVAAVTNIIVLSMLWYFGSISPVAVHAQTPHGAPLQTNPQAMESHFRLLAEDGIMRPDQPSYVAGTKVWTVADTRTGQCYVLFLVATSTAVSGPVACP